MPPQPTKRPNPADDRGQVIPRESGFALAPPCTQPRRSMRCDGHRRDRTHIAAARFRAIRRDHSVWPGTSLRSIFAPASVAWCSKAVRFKYILTFAERQGAFLEMCQSPMRPLCWGSLGASTNMWAYRIVAAADGRQFVRVRTSDSPAESRGRCAKRIRRGSARSRRAYPRTGLTGFEEECRGRSNRQTNRIADVHPRLGRDAAADGRPIG